MSLTKKVSFPLENYAVNVVFYKGLKTVNFGTIL